MQNSFDRWELVLADLFVLLQGCSWHVKDPNSAANPAKNLLTYPKHRTAAKEYPGLPNADLSNNGAQTAFGYLRPGPATDRCGHEPRFVVGVGEFAAARARTALEETDIVVGRINHPSPGQSLGQSPGQSGLGSAGGKRNGGNGHPSRIA